LALQLPADRRTAEDNAHAFKTPIAVIRQSLEPLRRALTDDNQRAQRAIGLVEHSLDRLDGLCCLGAQARWKQPLNPSPPPTGTTALHWYVSERNATINGSRHGRRKLGPFAERQSTAIDGSGQGPPHHGKLRNPVRIGK
jgi:hypothetical protein